MKAVLISIKPHWCELIASGEKTLEVRKTRPKLETPFKCYIYRTKGKVKHILNGKWFNMPVGGDVIGEFVCDTFVIDKTFGHDALFNGAACMTEIECAVYSCRSPLYGWHISDLKIYDKPKELSDFYKCGAFPIEDLDEDLCSHCSATDYGDHKEYHTPDGVYMCEGRFCADAYQEYLDDEFALTRPPQSWCYVEEDLS